MITYTLDITDRHHQHHTLIITSDTLPHRGDEIVIGPEQYYVTSVVHNIHETPYQTSASVVVRAS